MKNVVKAVLLIMSLALFFTMGCGDDDDDNKKITGPGGTTTTTNSLKATVSGQYSVNFSTNIVVATKNLSTNSTTLSGAFVAAGTTYNLTITINLNQGTGTFPLLANYTGENDGWAIFTATVNNDTDMYNSISGSVTFTQVTPRLIGTFSFTGQNFDEQQVTVASGSFNTSFTTN